MNTPTIFNFNTAPVRTITLEGEPWFIAKDVCDVLGYANPADAVSRHCKGVIVKRDVTDASGRVQEMTVIPERDLYRLIMRSKLPSAERFEEWVVGTVLPAIRKTGSYVTGEEALDPTGPDYIDRLKDLLIAAQERKLEAAAVQIAELKPKADAFEVIEYAAGSLTVTEAAKSLGSTQKKLFAYLEREGWITKGKKRQATARAIRCGRMASKTYTDAYDRIHTTPVITPKGLAHLAGIKAQNDAARALSV